MNNPSLPSRNIPDAPDLVTADLYQLFMEAKTRAGRSVNTLAAYDYMLPPFVKAHPVLPLEPETLEAYLVTWKHLSDETVHQAYRNLRTFYNWLVRRGHLDPWANPVLRLESPTRRRKTPRFLTLDELRRVLSVAKAPYERALMLTLIDTGVRIGELVGRTKDHIRGDSMLVEGKTGERIVPLSPEVRAYLQGLLTHHLYPSRRPIGTGPTMPEPFDVSLTRGGLQQAATSIIKRSGKVGPKNGPHVIRHSFGVHFLAQGGDAITLARILGHSTLSMTQRYAALSMEQISAKHRQYSALRGLMSMTPATLPEELPDVLLPDACYPPNLPDDVPVHMWLHQERRRGQPLRYYILATVDEKRRRIVSLGMELPLSAVDGYRLAIHRENQRRLLMDRAPGANDSRAGDIVKICAHCRQVKNDAGMWIDIAELELVPDEKNLSHGICPPCVQAHYPKELADKVLSRVQE